MNFTICSRDKKIEKRHRGSLNKKAEMIDTEKVLVIGYYDKKDFETLVDEEITDREFYDFIKYFVRGDMIYEYGEVIDVYKDWKKIIGEKKVKPETEKWLERWHKKGNIKITSIQGR